MLRVRPLLSWLVLLTVALLACRAAAQDATELGAWPVGRCDAIAAAGDLVAHASGAQLRISEVAGGSPVPQLRGTLTLPAQIVDLALQGTRVFASLGGRGFAIVDASDPAEPTLLSQPFLGRDVAATLPDGDLLYLATGYRFLVYGIGDPTAPALLGEVATGAQPRDLVQQGDLVYMPVHDAIAVLDVADPGAPQLAASHGGLALVGLTALSPGRLVGHSRYRVHVIDVGPDPGDLTEVGALTLGDGHTGRRGIAAHGDLAVIARQDAGMAVVDCSSPTAPQLVSVFQPPELYGAMDVAVAGDAIQLLEYDALVTVACDDPAQLMEVARQRVPAKTRHGAVAGALVAIASELGAFSLVDVTDPGQPRPLSVNLSDAWYQAVALVPPRAYVGARGVLEIWDVTDPEQPQRAATCAGPDWPREILHHAGHLYITSLDDGLTVLDLADPDAPVVTATFAGPQGAGACLGHGHLFTANRQEGVRIFSLADPAQPLLCTGWAEPGLATESVVFSGGHLYVGAGLDGLVVLDCQVPWSPAVRTRIDGRADHVTATRERLVASGGYYDAARIFDIGAPGTPVLVGTCEPRGLAAHLTADPQWVYVLAEEAALAILDVGGPVATEPAGPTPPPAAAPGIALSAFPNPANPRVTVRLALPAAAAARVAVYDLAGRRLRTLMSGRLAAGTHDLTWDGRDPDGRACPSGRYLVTLDTPGRRLTRQVTLIR